MSTTSPPGNDDQAKGRLFTRQEMGEQLDKATTCCTRCVLDLLEAIQARAHDLGRMNERTYWEQLIKPVAAPQPTPPSGLMFVEIPGFARVTARKACFDIPNLGTIRVECLP